MKTVNVVAAIIIKDGKVFATQRGYGEWEGWWEFPGGKTESGETPQQALVREIQEELSTEVSARELLHTIEYDYPTFHLSMQCFLCQVISGKLSLNEHEDAKWLSKDELYSVQWLPADMDILPKIESIL